MLKKILLTIFLISNITIGQTHITGEMSPINNDYKWVILYQLKGANQIYISNVDIKEGKFKVDFPENSAKGMYRLTYDIEKEGYVDFLYNNENINVTFNPKFPFESLKYSTSEENKLYNEYVVETTLTRQKLDSLQLSYFQSQLAHQKAALEETYKTVYETYKNQQKYFNEISEGKLANHFIKSSFKYYAPEIIKSPQEYLISEKEHYFDYINFNDEELRNSIFLSEKVIDYVFYLNRSDDEQVQNALYKNAVIEVFQKVGGNNSLRSELSTVLMFTFSQIQNTTLTKLVLESVYKKLPNEYIDELVINEILLNMKLALGEIAPDFSWLENDKIVKFSELNTTENYVLVFWSTTCSHCLIEVPQLYEFTNNTENIKVIAIALEDNDVDFKINTAKFKNWSNVLALGKWQNNIAKEYKIISTPTYFVLDKDKRIIAKPEFYKDVKAFFEN